MKPLIIKLILAVQSYTVPVADLESILSEVVPVEIQVIDLANPQPVKDFYKLHYEVVKLEVKSTIEMFLHAPFIDENGWFYIAEKTHKKSGVVTVAIANREGFEEQNKQRIVHGFLHACGVLHNNDHCNVMNEIPCGLGIRPEDVLKCRKNLEKGKL